MYMHEPASVSVASQNTDETRASKQYRLCIHLSMKKNYWIEMVINPLTKLWSGYKPATQAHAPPHAPPHFIWFINWKCTEEDYKCR